MLYFGLTSTRTPLAGTMARMHIGDRIRSRRKALGMTQQMLAKQVGITRGAVSQVEKRHTHGPRPEHLLAYAKALRTTPAELVHGQGAGDTPVVPAIGEPSAAPYRSLTDGERDLLEYIRNAARGAEQQRDRLARVAISLLLALATQPVPDAAIPPQWNANHREEKP
jgi:transcriptional regulator with XRE-family HTH domain